MFKSLVIALLSVAATAHDNSQQARDECNRQMNDLNNRFNQERQRMEQQKQRENQQLRQEQERQRQDCERRLREKDNQCRQQNQNWQQNQNQQNQNWQQNQNQQNQNWQQNQNQQNQSQQDCDGITNQQQEEFNRERQRWNEERERYEKQLQNLRQQMERRLQVSQKKHANRMEQVKKQLQKVKQRLQKSKEQKQKIQALAAMYKAKVKKLQEQKNCQDNEAPQGDLQQELDQCMARKVSLEQQLDAERENVAQASRELIDLESELENCQNAQPSDEDEETNDQPSTVSDDENPEDNFDEEIDSDLVLGEGGEASTTRYWDCSGGSCGCGFGNGSNPTHCSANALFQAPANNAYGARFYGTAAISGALGGDYWLSEACGKCFRLTGKANIDPHTEESTIVLKAANFCPDSNSVCANGKFHFDIAAPGFDYAGASDHNRCDSNQNEQALKHPQTCGYWRIHDQNPDVGCNCNDINDTVLRNGCQNFRDLNWDNPKVTYQPVRCPPELERMPCWAENGNDWPSSPPKYCANPFA